VRKDRLGEKKRGGNREMEQASSLGREERIGDGGKRKKVAISLRI